MLNTSDQPELPHQACQNTRARENRYHGVQQPLLAAE